MGAEDDARATLGDRSSDLFGGRNLAPLVRERLHVEPVLLADRQPALAERTGTDDGDLVSRAREVRDGRIHRSGPGRAEQQHVRFRGKDTREPRQAAFVRVPEVRAPVMNHRLGHRSEHFGRNGRRARRKQVALLHDVQASWRAR